MAIIKRKNIPLNFWAYILSEHYDRIPSDQYVQNVLRVVICKSFEKSLAIIIFLTRSKTHY